MFWFRLIRFRPVAHSVRARRAAAACATTKRGVEMSRFSLKTAIAFAVSVLIVGLILFLLMRGGPEDGLGGIILEGDRAAVPVPEGAAPRDAPPAPDTAAAVQAEEEPGDEPEEERLPLLSGTVFGERGPLPGATVRAYPFAMIKELISKYESLSIGGLGDIPALIRQVRSDVLALRGAASSGTPGPTAATRSWTLHPANTSSSSWGPGTCFARGTRR